MVQTEDSMACYNNKDFNHLKVKSASFKSKSTNDGTCFNCVKKDHFKKDCRFKPKPKEQDKLNLVAIIAKVESSFIDTD